MGRSFGISQPSRGAISVGPTGPLQARFGQRTGASRHRWPQRHACSRLSGNLFAALQRIQISSLSAHTTLGSAMSLCRSSRVE